MDSLARVKLAIYHWFARTTTRPAAADIAGELQIPVAEATGAFKQLRKNRVLYLEDDGETIRMAPPFSGVPTQHVARVGGKEYYANCAWDVLGIMAALKTPGTARSRCEQTLQPLRLDVQLDHAPVSNWVFHCVVPAARWWHDLVFT